MLVTGLHDQVNMIVLDAEVDDAEVLAAGRGQRGLAYSLIDATPTEIPDGTHRPQRDMHGVSRVQKRPLLVRRTGARSWADVLRRAACHRALRTASAGPSSRSAICASHVMCSSRMSINK